MVNVHLIFLAEEIGMFQKYVSIKVSVNLYEDNRKIYKTYGYYQIVHIISKLNRIVTESSSCVDIVTIE